MVEETGEKSGSESVGTVIVAGLANLAIAVAKLVAGLISGSSAMLSEAMHSAADTVTEVLLFVAVRRADHPADSRHPFGHGMAGFFWALMAAFATLIGGAGFSITHGLHEISHGEELADLRISYVVLAVSFVIEGISFLKALSQVRGEARRLKVSPQRYVAKTSDTALKAVLFEDAAALVGLLIAAGGLLAYQLTGSSLWDGVASVVIGLLLLGVALNLIRTNVSLLIGQAAPVRMEQEIRAELLAQPEVDAVVELLTMMLGPSEVLVAARVDFADDTTGAALERAADQVERRLGERFPSISQVFLDPTPGRSAQGRRMVGDDADRDA
ncbi:cation diffusion facilitator family transporter [Streptosporangium sp. NBC_01756]|uniref:cation diffusion facilitator family transporter n=1 Tax=Streptosporangium sp. NBC_01756 TaxID=2975950 RepID=UPI002DDAF4B9|nr:cation diffusion facilitator family transporter [Streptosporangium sp. NBC_01756]WSC85203.1 cation diffusion facilitator family transporter [Streptosporangium sp. NBC_01756]